MTDTIVKLLKEAGLYAWELSDVKTRGREYYFIRHALEQNRVKDVEHIRVKVFRLLEDGKRLGSASCELAPTAGEAELRGQIRALAERAALVKNRPYTLRGAQEGEEPAADAPVDPDAIARDFLRCLRTVPETAGEDINSYEIFVAEKTRRFLNSAGVDVSERFPESMVEVVVNARREGEEIELYRSYRSGVCDAEALRRDLLQTLRCGRDRLTAKPTPPLGRAKVLFAGRDAVSLYRYFAERLNAAMVYRGMSDWKLGEPAADFRGDRPCLEARRELPGSSRNRRFDGEGAPIRDTLLLEDGVARTFLGSRMYSSYLGLEDAFIPTNFAVSGGTHGEEELRAGTYLEVAEFSDFQVDGMTGDLFGEIRLAYWHENGAVTPVTGGSLSGSMRELAEEMRFTRERRQYDNWLIPAATLLEGVTVTGIA